MALADKHKHHHSRRRPDWLRICQRSAWGRICRSNWWIWPNRPVAPAAARCRCLSAATTGKQGITFHLGSATQQVQRHGQRLSPDAAKRHAVRYRSGVVGDWPATTHSMAQQAGPVVQRGISVNRQLQTSDPTFMPLGDCAEVTGHLLPFVMPIMQAARALAATPAALPR